MSAIGRGLSQDIGGVSKARRAVGGCAGLSRGMAGPPIAIAGRDAGRGGLRGYDRVESVAVA